MFVNCWGLNLSVSQTMFVNCWSLKPPRFPTYVCNLLVFETLCGLTSCARCGITLHSPGGITLCAMYAIPLHYLCSMTFAAMCGLTLPTMCGLTFVRIAWPNYPCIVRRYFVRQVRHNLAQPFAVSLCAQGAAQVCPHCSA
jgi:hypothetical protein